MAFPRQTAQYAKTSGLKPRDLYNEGERAPRLPASENAGANSAVSRVSRHLGLRYNMLLIDPPTKQARAVDPDGKFKAGDCFAIELSPNRDGYLYISNLGSSGEWQPLLPSLLMPNEASSVKAGAKVRNPQE